MKPICVPCHRFYRMVKSGYYFIEGMPIPQAFGVRVESGTADPDNWKPYKLWSGDLWRCEGCGHQIISGTGLLPIAEHYQSHFTDTAKRLDAEYQVNDC